MNYIAMTTCSQSYSCNLWGVYLMQVKLGIGRVWPKCELALHCWWRSFALIIPDNSTRHTPFNLSWEAITYISTQAKDAKKNRGKIQIKLENKQITNLNRKQILTALYLCGLDLNTRYMWLATICKKIQLQRSYETQETDETRSNTNLN